MSLDLYFYNRGSCVCEACGNEHEGEREVWRGNITHNLTQMADLALLYVPCWRPEEVVQRADPPPGGRAGRPREVPGAQPEQRLGVLWGPGQLRALPPRGV